MVYLHSVLNKLLSVGNGAAFCLLRVHALCLLQRVGKPRGPAGVCENVRDSIAAALSAPRGFVRRRKGENAHPSLS